MRDVSIPNASTVADPEIELMLRVQQDEPGAFAELVAAYWSRVFGRFVKQFADRQEAEDLVQEVFLRLYRSRKRYCPKAKLTTWIFFIARNVGRNAIRRRRRKKLLPIGLPGLADEGSGFQRLTDERSPNSPLERAELAQVVRVAVATLNIRQRRAVEMQFDDRTYSEIAVALSMTPKAAKSLLYRARHELRDVLGEFAEP